MGVAGQRHPAVRPGAVLGAGSFNAGARDLARLGLLMAHDGAIAGRRVVPPERPGRAPRHVPLLAAGALGSSGYGHYGYSTLWWTVERGAMTGLGVHGQYLFVDPAAEVVIVKCSAWPALDDEELDRETITALRQIAEALG